MATPWSVPALFPDQTIAVCGTGPSLTDDICAALAGVPVIAVNDAYRKFPDAAIVFAHDCSWWLVHEQTVLKHPGILVSNDMVPQPIVRCLRVTGEHDFDPDPSCVRHGNNSGYSGLCVGVHTRPRKILLCGFDMRPTGHFFGEHPLPLRTTKPQTFERWIKNFNEVAPIYAFLGIDVVDCSIGGALTCFRKSTVQAELA